MPLSTAVANDILDHLTGKSVWTPPAAFYVALSSSLPTVGGGNVTEPSGGSYARVQITAAQFDAASNGATENNAQVTFPPATADWFGGSNATHAAIYDAPTGGNFLGFAQLTTAKPFLNGDTGSIPAGDLDLLIN